MIPLPAASSEVAAACARALDEQLEELGVNAAAIDAHRYSFDEDERTSSPLFDSRGSSPLLPEPAPLQPTLQQQQQQQPPHLTHRSVPTSMPLPVSSTGRKSPTAHASALRDFMSPPLVRRMKRSLAALGLSSSSLSAHVLPNESSLFEKRRGSCPEIGSVSPPLSPSRSSPYASSPSARRYLPGVVHTGRGCEEDEDELADFERSFCENQQQRAAPQAVTLTASGLLRNDDEFFFTPAFSYEAIERSADGANAGPGPAGSSDVPHDPTSTRGANPFRVSCASSAEASSDRVRGQTHSVPLMPGYVNNTQLNSTSRAPAGDAALYEYGVLDIAQVAASIAEDTARLTSEIDRSAHLFGAKQTPPPRNPWLLVASEHRDRDRDTSGADACAPLLLFSHDDPWRASGSLAVGSNEDVYSAQVDERLDERLDEQCEPEPASNSEGIVCAPDDWSPSRGMQRTHSFRDLRESIDRLSEPEDGSDVSPPAESAGPGPGPDAQDVEVERVETGSRSLATSASITATAAGAPVRALPHSSTPRRVLPSAPEIAATWPSPSPAAAAATGGAPEESAASLSFSQVRTHTHCCSSSSQCVSNASASADAEYCAASRTTHTVFIEMSLCTHAYSLHYIHTRTV